MTENANYPALWIAKPADSSANSNSTQPVRVIPAGSLRQDTKEQFMGSHDCRVSGLINVKPAVTEADVRKALHGFLKTHGREYEKLARAGRVGLQDGQLHLHRRLVR